MSIAIWSTHLNKQIIVKGRLDEWVDSAMEGEEEIQRLMAEAMRLTLELNEARAEANRLRSSLDAIKRLLDSGFVP